MCAAPPAALEALDAFLSGETPLRDFERWVYATPELERALGGGAYLDLIAFDYRQRDAGHELRRLVETIYERLRPGLLIRDRVRRLACGLARGSVPLHRAVHALANLYYAGHEWIPADFAGISSELDLLPEESQHPLWHPDALAERRPRWEAASARLAEQAAASARELLRREFPDAPCA